MGKSMCELAHQAWDCLIKGGFERYFQPVELSKHKGTCTRTLTVAQGNTTRSASTHRWDNQMVLGSFGPFLTCMAS